MAGGFNKLLKFRKRLSSFWICSMAEKWTDKFVEQDDKSQDIRRGRPESALYR